MLFLDGWIFHNVLSQFGWKKTTKSIEYVRHLLLLFPEFPSLEYSTFHYIPEILSMDESGSWFMCCTLKRRRHYCGSGVQRNTFTLTVEAEMFGLITGSSRPLRQMKVVCVNVEFIQSQSTSLKLVMTQALEKITLTYCFCPTSTVWMWKCCVEELIKPSRNYLLA